MADYTVLLIPTAQKQLDQLPESVADTLLEVIELLATDPRPDGCKKLKGRLGYRIRKGNYRIWSPECYFRISSLLPDGLREKLRNLDINRLMPIGLFLTINGLAEALD